MIDFNYSSIEEIHDLFKKRQLTVRELILSSLSRIIEFEKCPKGLNAVLEINPDALFIADEFDEKLRNGHEITPLFGIPILLKDNINTADKLHTSAGSVALADNYAPYDAYLVKHIRKAGAIILGKTNMTEFANYLSGDGLPSGYSSRGGQAVNPYNRAITPLGSSSGSAIGLATGMCTISIGTETAGSIMGPSTNNGVVGIKPTLGLVGRSGIIPISSTFDTAGPMARTVQDAAVLLGVIAGVDPDDAACRRMAVTNKFPIDYTKYCDRDGLKGMRIGINRAKRPEDSDLKEEETAAFDNLCKVITAAGAVLIDNVNIESNTFPESLIVMRDEFKACMNYYLSTLKGSSSMKTIKDIIAYNQANAAVALKYGQSRIIDAENNTGTMTESAYFEILHKRETCIAKLNGLFDENRLDILLCENKTLIAPFTGFPSMTIPVGQRKDKLPIGSYWIARRYDESSLIKAAYAAEQLLGLKLRPDIGEKSKSIN